MMERVGMLENLVSFSLNSPDVLVITTGDKRTLL
jgi:hypothetical protein